MSHDTHKLFSDPGCNSQGEEGGNQTTGKEAGDVFLEEVKLAITATLNLSGHVETSIFLGWHLSEKTFSWKKVSQESLVASCSEGTGLEKHPAVSDCE